MLNLATLLFGVAQQFVSHHTFGTEFGGNQITIGDQSFEIVETSGLNNNCFFAALAHAGIQFERPDLVNLLLSAPIADSVLYQQWIVNDQIEADFQGTVQDYILNHIGAPESEHGFHMFGFGLHDAGILDIIADSLDVEIQIIYYPENGDAPIIRTTLGGANPARRKITLMLRGRHFQYLRPVSFGIMQDNPPLIERQNSADPGRNTLMSYGNKEGHEIFKDAREKIIAVALESERSFDDIIKLFASTRQKIAVDTESKAAPQFGEFRTENRVSGSLVMLYPIMRHRFGDILARYNLDSKNWTSLDENLQYRIREIDCYQPNIDSFEAGSFPIYITAFTIMASSGGGRIMKRSDFNADGNIVFEGRHLRFLNAVNEGTSACRILYLETRVRPNARSPWLFGRSLISGVVGPNPNFHAESAMFLVHPGSEAIAQFYLPRLKEQFNLIKSGKNTFTELQAREAIGRLIYLSSVAMLTRRGWSAITEWIAEYSYRLLNVQGRPVGRAFAYWDQIAQSCLTEEEFLAIYLGSFPPIR